MKVRLKRDKPSLDRRVSWIVPTRRYGLLSAQLQEGIILAMKLKKL